MRVLWLSIYSSVQIYYVDCPRREEKPRSHNQQLRINFLCKRNKVEVQTADTTIGYQSSGKGRIENQSHCTVH